MTKICVYIPFDHVDGEQVSGIAQCLLGKETCELSFTREVGDMAPLDDESILIVNAHGSSGNAKLYSNVGKESLTAETLIDNLDIIRACNARSIYFAICFSLYPNHICQLWYEHCRDDLRIGQIQPIYGSSEIFQGGLFLETRHSVIMKVDNDPRLKLYQSDDV
jgi:hypothetical protein